LIFAVHRSLLLYGYEVKFETDVTGRIWTSGKESYASLFAALHENDVVVAEKLTLPHQQ
jgi:hypothetical protein